MSTLYVVHLPAATPPHVITSDPAEVQSWLDDGTAAAVYELDAVQTYPAAELPVETPEEAP